MKPLWPIHSTAKMDELTRALNIPINVYESPHLHPVQCWHSRRVINQVIYMRLYVLERIHLRFLPSFILST